MKIRPVGAELFHVERQTDRQPDRQTWRSTQSPVAILRARLTAFCPHSEPTHVLTHSDCFPGAVNQSQVKLHFYRMIPGFEKACFLSYPDFTHLTFCAEWPWSWGELLSICGNRAVLGEKCLVVWKTECLPLGFELSFELASYFLQCNRNSITSHPARAALRPLYTTAIFPLDTANI